MHVRSSHHRDVDADVDAVWGLIDTLGSDDDRLWCPDLWPPDMRIRFDTPLGIGATGGHGTTPYVVESYASGSILQFRFLPGSGIDGTHGFTTDATTDGRVRVTHEIDGDMVGAQSLMWPLIRPFHDAYIEDIFDRIEEQAAGPLTHRHRGPRWLRAWNAVDTWRQRRHAPTARSRLAGAVIFLAVAAGTVSTLRDAR